jgi:antitoxin (DNA-binding transcriptional repressor) of toxin-antitoxin stability system
MTVSIEEMERDLPGYLGRVQAGETLVVLKAGTPVAEIRPVSAAPASTRPKRPFGLCAGEFTVPDDFDDPLPEEILYQFEGR